ncbi:40S ribosomal protein [Mycena venus]|uniref:40S ribosomal protein n=1 Tax=Mycena venus TaxID=2733690 RepID=A0A8H6YML3_9AGAR|nr:40S ribosomal protein [Mycena venus]
MDALKRVVKVEQSTHPGQSEAAFRSSSLCRALHPSGFIEFADVASAERALSLELSIPGVRVFDVASQPRLVNQYRVVNPSAFEEGDDLQSNSATGRSSGSLVGRDRVDDVLPSSNPSSVPETGLLLQSLKSSDAPVSCGSGPQADTVENRPTSSNDPLLPFTPSVALSHSLPAHLSSPPPSSSSAANPFHSIENRILMRLCGENITLDLRSLPGNPATVIELLKVTLSERANWLVVAAYYRRNGNPEGAVAVVTAMLEALKQFNIPENDLKPAFLLLSGCETDLGKLARSKGDTDKGSEHYSNAQKWLHQVYGADIPPVPSDQPSAVDPKCKGTTPPRAPASLRSRIDTSGTAPSAPRSHPPSPNQRMLEREIQSLRDRHTHNTNVLADVRASKRKLEDTVEVERVVRRRLQRELDEVMKERDIARRMETLALDQMKREVDARRRAEDRAEEERELRKRAERSAEFALLQRTAQYPGVPMAAPMHQQDGFYQPAAFDSHSHRISF